MHSHSSIIHSSEKIETAEVFINRWINKSLNYYAIDRKLTPSGLLWIGKWFLGHDIKSTGKKKKKGKIDKLEYIKIKSVCIKEQVKKMERKYTEWNKIFANHISDKVLISRIL